MSAPTTDSPQGRVERPSLSDPASEKRPISPYFKFEKSLFDCLLRSLAGVELKVALAIERRTTGHYAQPDAEIAVSLLADLTGCSKNAVLNARRRLIEKGVIIEVRPHTTRRPARLRLNRDPEWWGTRIEPPSRDHMTTRGSPDGPQAPQPYTSRGTDAPPPEVPDDDLLNGSNGFEEPIEPSPPPADPSEGSPDENLQGFYAALEGVPRALTARLKRRDLVPGETP